MTMDTSPLHRRSAGQRWSDTEQHGVSVSGLRRNEEGGASFLVRIAPGARVPMHDHPGGEEVYVISGRARIGDVDVEAGDYLWTPPGGAHDLEARDETVIFVSAPNGVRFVEGEAGRA
jgi:quercetin dioxygenase-like cupin family protein